MKITTAHHINVARYTNGSASKLVDGYRLARDIEHELNLMDRYNIPKVVVLATSGRQWPPASQYLTWAQQCDLVQLSFAHADVAAAWIQALGGAA